LRATLLFFHCGDAWIRGSEVVLLNLLSGLSRERYRILLVCDQEVLAERARRDAGVEAEVVPIPEIMWDGGHLRLEVVQWLRTVRRLKRKIQGEGVSLLYCNSALPSQTGYFAARRCGIPVICHLHAPYTRRFAWLYRFHRTDATLFVSHFVLGLLKGKVRFAVPPLVVHNGVDTTHFAPATHRDPSHRSRLGIPTDAPVIGQVGSLLKRKGADVAIRAIAEPEPTARGVRLVLVGEGPEETKLRELSESLGVSDRVTFTGQDPNPLRFYQHVFDVNLLASRSEAMGLALLEGAACGLPGLGANAEGTPEALIDGESGILFPSEDHEALARLIERLADDRGLRERMGRRAREIALERFTVERQVGEIDGVISRLLGEGARRRAKTPDPDR
jgi:hypothetical protein